MSELRLVCNGDDRGEAVGRLLLAMHRVRRCLERLTDRHDPDWRVSMEMTSSALLCALRELVAALDRRAPQAHRAGEVSIARDSALLKAGATRRIAELERERG